MTFEVKSCIPVDTILIKEEYIIKYIIIVNDFVIIKYFLYFYILHSLILFPLCGLIHFYYENL